MPDTTDSQKIGIILMIPIGIIILLFLGTTILPGVFNALGSQGYGMAMSIRKTAVSLVQGVTPDFFGVGNGIANSVLDVFQKTFSNTLQKTVYSSSSITEIKKCDMNAGTTCNNLPEQPVKFEQTGNSGRFTVGSDTYVLNQGTDYSSVKNDVLIKYSAGEKTVISRAPSLFQELYSQILNCYQAMNMNKEGNPLYKSSDPNPYLCAQLNITIDKNNGVDLTLEDFYKFMETTVNPDTKRIYALQFKPLQLSYCFETNTCLRAGKGNNENGKVCLPREVLDYEESFSIQEQLSGFQKLLADVSFVTTGGVTAIACSVSTGFVGTAGCFVVGGVVGSESSKLLMSITNGEVTCDTQKMKQDFTKTSLENKSIKIYYFDDNGDEDKAYLRTGNDKFDHIKGALLKDCSNALVLGSQNYDYMNRQVDPLVICLEDL